MKNPNINYCSVVNYDLIMQNKANFRKPKMNESLFATKAYENETALRLEQNKPKQSQSVFFSAVNK